jgi:hypothetical protein
MEFKEVAPGVFVNEQKIKVLIPHPDPCWVICNAEGTAAFVNGCSLFVFSSEEKARIFMKNQPDNWYSLKKYNWDALVKEYSGYFKTILVDHSGENCFCSVVPLKRGI